VDEADLLERFFEGGVHLAALSPYTYVQAERRGTPGIRLIAKPVTASGPLQKGVILTRNNSGIRNLGSLVSKRFCFVSPGSTSGYLYPRALLRQAGLDPDYSFSSTSFGQEHLNTLRLLDRGVCDAAAMSAGAVKAGEKAGMPPDRFHQLAATEPIPYDAYAVLATMPSDETQAIAAALLALEPDSAVARSVLSGGKSDITGFTRATDSDYDPVRRIERFLSGDEEAR
jgi:phosphate/phosphite/phosphonate ABC transporter binding protein